MGASVLGVVRALDRVPRGPAVEPQWFSAFGMVLGLQGYNTLVRFGAEQSLGAVVGLSLIREIGPVLTALLAKFGGLP